MGIKVGIIGGTGRMGSWFAGICEKVGAEVFKVGRRTRIRPEDVASSCDIVVISVPISATYDMIKKIGPLIPETSLFMDLTSVKEMPISAMLKYSNAEVLGLHPLFGEDIDPDLPKKVAICDGRGKRWKGWVIDILRKSGFELIFLDPKEHDRLMGIIQGINHFETMSLALKMKNSGISFRKIKDASTQTFMKKLKRIEKMFEQEPELFCSLLMDNSWSLDFIGSYLSDAKYLFGIIKNKDREGFKEIFYSIRQFLKEEKNETDMGKS